MSAQPQMTEMSLGRTVRPFQRGDETAFRELNEAWISKYFRIEEKDRETLGNPQKYILGAGGEIFMALVDGETVGCVALVKMSDTTMELAKMAVDEDYRGQGIGRSLIAAAIDWARSRCLHRLYLETNHTLTPAINLYRSMGFTDVPEERVMKSPYKRADVFMELWLVPRWVECL
ncbi:MAG TPA: GNAT family N-acetyltransferase [Terriglobales bacterium]|nr:GNAT family N-acetyltransferase [Terriglobales bacterium]